jgi:ubiquinone/menaquinone biosynthesis C-methylase UbiE
VKAATYDRLNDRVDSAGFAERRDALVSTLDGVVLEIGAGTGRNIPRYTRAARVIALEPSGEFATRLRSRAAEATLPVQVLRGYAESIPLPAASVDHVVTSLTLCSVNSLAAALTECRRLLRPGGTLEFLEHVRSGGLRGHFQDWLTPLQRRFVDGCHLNRDIVAAIRTVGLDIVALQRFTMPPGNPLLTDGITGRAVG